MKPYMNLMLLACGLYFVSTPSFSDSPGAHPSYIHALEDLKIAQAAILARKGSSDMTAHEQRAVLHTKDAQWIIRSFLSPDDKKQGDIVLSADVDPSKTMGGLHDARVYLEKAIADCNQAESNTAAVNLRNRDVQEIKAALYDVNAAITDFEQHR